MPKPTLNEAFFDRLRDQFATDDSNETEIRREARLDLRFLAGGDGQWNPTVLAIRRNPEQDRPCLTFNILHIFVAQVANEARQQKVAPKVRPVDSVADPDTAKVYAGLLRHIHYATEGDVAKETALYYASGCSFGYVGIKSDYCDYETTDQEIQYRTFPDPFSVYGVLIPACLGQKPDHSFVVESIPRDEYKAKYGEIDAEWEGGGGGWISDKYVRIAQYQWIDYEEVKVEGRGKVRKPRVYSVLTNGFKDLDETFTDVPGEEIPIWPVLGEVVMVDGRPYVSSVIRHARDPQQLLNYYKTSIAETLALAPRAPFVGPTGSFRTDPNWSKANVLNLTHLEYDPVLMPNGSFAPGPQRQQAEPPIQALSQAAAQEGEALKATTNIHDASLGSAGNETSGRAIDARKAQSGLSNFHFLDNLSRADKRMNRCLIRWIPSIYDTPRELRILGDDHKEALIKANQAGGFDLTAGKYDIVVDEGPAYKTEQQEQQQILRDTIQFMGPQGIVLVPTLLRAMDQPDAANQVEKTLPPELRSQTQQIDPAMFQQMQQQHQQLLETVQAQESIIENKKVEAQAQADLEEKKLANAKYIAELNAQTELLKQQMTLESAEARALLQAKVKELEAQLQQGHETRLKLVDQEFQREKQVRDQAHDAGMASADMAHEHVTTAVQHEHDSEMADKQAAMQPEPSGE